MLMLLVSFLLFLVCEDASGQMIVFHSPKDGSRVWADEDHPVKIDVEILDFKFKKGYGRLFGNGKDMGVELGQARTVINIPEIAEGVHTIEVKLFDRSGEELGISNATHFQKFTYLERAEHEEYYVTAEAPRSDGTLDRLPGMEDWIFGIQGYTNHSNELKQLFHRFLTKDQAERATPALLEYKKKHDRIMSDPSSWNKERFVIFRNIAVGLGNQIESMVSAFMLAIVTNRTFLCDATPIHHLFQPPDIDWHYTPIPENVNHDYIYSNSKLVDLRWSNPLEFPQFLCEDLDVSLPQQYLFIMSDQYYLPAMLHNKRYAKRIRQAFGGDIFGSIVRWLLRPKDWVAHEVMHFYNQNLRAAKHVVGIQVRTATMSGYDIEYMAYDAFAWNDFPPAYWKCALLHLPPSVASSEDDVVFMLVTDHPKIRQMAREALAPSKVVFFEQPITRKNMAGHATALIDIILLSLSDQILTTSMSTFGYVACGWSSVIPTVVTYQSTCLREITSQPCFHKWSYLHTAQCYDKRRMISPEVRFCGPMTPPQTLAEPVW